MGLIMYCKPGMGYNYRAGVPNAPWQCEAQAEGRVQYLRPEDMKSLLAEIDEWDRRRLWILTDYYIRVVT